MTDLKQYGNLLTILQQPVAKLPNSDLLWNIPWGHHAEYTLTRALPANLKSSLPSVEELEAELSGEKEAKRTGKQSANEYEC